MKMNKITLRKAQRIDKNILLTWRNDPATRRNSINTCVISEEEHSKWFETVFSKPTRLQLIGLDSEDKPVGQVRFDVLENNIAEVDVGVAPKERGKGFGGDLIKQGSLFYSVLRHAEAAIT